MNHHPTGDRYDRIAQATHWLAFLLLVGSFGAGLYMVGLQVSPAKLRLYSYHKWIGVTVFGLVLLRLLWRARHPAPALPPSMPSWERAAARMTHAGLYLLLLAIPLSGWLMSSAKGFQTVYFGALPIPDLVGKNPALGEQLERVHWVLNKTLLGLVGLHTAAALKHHFHDRDDVLARMLPGLRARSSSRAPR